MHSKKQKKQVEYRSLDYKKAIFSRPEGLFELVILVILLMLSFSVYFGPLLLSPMGPVRAILVTIIPAFCLGWILFSIVRVLRYKDKYTIKK